MTTNDPGLRNIITWLTTHSDATKDLRRDAKDALQNYDDATALHAQIADDNTANLARLRDAELAALKELCDEPTRDNVRTVVDLRQLYDDTQARQLREIRAAEYATNVARHSTAHLFSHHTDALLHVIAVERCRDVSACGDDAVPQVVRDTWAKLNYQWHPSLDEVLLLNTAFRGSHQCPQRKHVPLTWAKHEPVALRKTLQWIWQQVAAGEVRRVNTPLTRQQRNQGLQPGSNGTCLRLTADLEVSPGRG